MEKIVTYDSSLQMNLLEVAEETSKLSRDIATSLRTHVRDYMSQIEIAAGFLHDALMVIDADGIVQFINQSAERIFGWRAQEITGQTVTLLFHHTSGIPVTVGSLMEVFTKEECFTLPMADTPINGVMGYRRDDTPFYIDVTVSSFPRKNGRLDYILIVRDVGKYVEAQKEILSGEIHYRTIFEEAPDGIAVIQNGRIVETNDRLKHMFGDLTGGSFDGLLPEEDCHKINLAVSDHLRGVAEIYDFRIHNGDYLVSLVPVETTTKRPATLLTIRDLSCTR